MALYSVWVQQTDGSKNWHRKHNFPRLGISTLYYDLGEKDLLGHAWGLWPHVGLPLWRKNNFDFFINFGFGLGRINRVFNRINNPENNAIGSHWNYLVNFNYKATWQISKQTAFMAGFHLTHFSNGAFRLPNLGVNLLAVQTGIRYIPKPKSEDPKNNFHSTYPTLKNKWGINFYSAMGYREFITAGGPRYPIYQVSIAATYRLNIAHKFIAGFDYEYNRGVFAFGKHIEYFSNNRRGTWLSSRIMFFIADEIMFGNWGILFQFGTYLNSNALLLPSSVYFKLGSRYYLPPVGKSKSRFFAAFYLKAHGASAEYTSLGIGIEL